MSFSAQPQADPPSISALLFLGILQRSWKLSISVPELGKQGSTERLLSAYSPQILPSLMAAHVPGATLGSQAQGSASMHPRISVVTVTSWLLLRTLLKGSVILQHIQVVLYLASPALLPPSPSSLGNVLMNLQVSIYIGASQFPDPGPWVLKAEFLQLKEMSKEHLGGSVG